MKWIFWASLALIVYTYAGYPLWLYLRSRRRPRPIHTADSCPTVSIVVAVYNEEQALPRKLRNLLELTYPSDRCEIVVVSDGSSDGTDQILREHTGERLRAFMLPQHQGKASALNRGIQEARGDILVFTDARQMIEVDALQHLVANFADPQVGCVSGELMLGDPAPGSQSAGAGLYWRIEKRIRNWEALSGSVVGATGALYAVRRSLVVPLPPGTVLDDVYIPMQAARQGTRIAFEPQARAWDALPATLRQEFRRKVRTLTGNYQLLQLAPWLLSPANPLLFRFVSHKLFRLLIPFALAGVFVSSLLLPTGLYQAAALLQIMFYSLGLLALARPGLSPVSRLANMPLTFLMLNTAAVVAFFNFVSRRRVVWVR
jgi:poly-beta-1,6-N-acetyl-D-glucosamine synthase